MAELRHFLPLADLLGGQGVEGQIAPEYPRPEEKGISMKPTPTDLARPFLAQASRLLLQVHLPRIEACVRQLSPDQIWWRANPVSNSVGNLALHLEGNVRQWIVSGLGGAPDRRQRDKEFSELGPISRPTLLARLRKTVADADRVMRKLNGVALARTYSIQGFRVTGLRAVFHVTEHFSHHAGQIILLTKMLGGKALKFTHLPEGRKKKQKERSIPAL
jgi:uncharacterized damage-inducible protein DinB